VLAALGDSGFEAGSSWPLDGSSLAARVRETARSWRIDDYAELDGTIAAVVRDGPIRSTVGVPIVVGGNVWGLICVGADRPELLAPDTETRLSDFTELIATAISNAEARDDLRRLADEQ